MIAGEAIVYYGEQDRPQFSGNVLIEITDFEGPFVEIAFDIGKRRTYVRFRLSDFKRELKELQSASKAKV